MNNRQTVGTNDSQLSQKLSISTTTTGSANSSGWSTGNIGISFRIFKRRIHHTFSTGTNWNIKLLSVDLETPSRRSDLYERSRNTFVENYQWIYIFNYSFLFPLYLPCSMYTYTTFLLPSTIHTYITFNCWDSFGKFPIIQDIDICTWNQT